MLHEVNQALCQIVAGAGRKFDVCQGQRDGLRALGRGGYWPFIRASRWRRMSVHGMVLPVAAIFSWRSSASARKSSHRSSCSPFSAMVERMKLCAAVPQALGGPGNAFLELCYGRRMVVDMADPFAGAV